MAHCCLGWKFIINLFSPKCLLNMVRRKKEKKNGQVRGSSFFLLLLWSSFTEMEIVLGEPLGGFSLLRKILLLEEKVNHHSVMKMTPQQHS